MIFEMSSEDSDGSASSHSARAPATVGADMEVPKSANQ